MPETVWYMLCPILGAIAAACCIKRSTVEVLSSFWSCTIQICLVIYFCGLRVKVILKRSSNPFGSSPNIGNFGQIMF